MPRCTATDDTPQLLEIVHPAARILVDIARSQDAEVGDGTTSVVVLAGEILKELKDHVEQGVSAQTIIKGVRRASAMAVNKIKEIAVNTEESNRRETLAKLAATAMNSKLIKRNAPFFTQSEFDRERGASRAVENGCSGDALGMYAAVLRYCTTMQPSGCYLLTSSLHYVARFTNVRFQQWSLMRS